MTSHPTFRLAFALVLCVAVIGSTSCSKSPSVSSDTVSSAMSLGGPVIAEIAKTVPGLSEAQAILGAGGALGLAKNNMSADAYKQVSQAVPGTDALVANALKQGLPSTAKSLSDASAFLSKAGITNDQMKQIANTVGGSMKSKVPGQVADAFVAAVQ